MQVHRYILNSRMIFIFATQLQCCGIHTYRDWVFSSCHCLPISCCQYGYEKNCSSLLTGQPDIIHLQSSSHLTHQIEKLVWPQSCSEKIEQAFRELQTTWIALPLISIFIQIVILCIAGYFYFVFTEIQFYEINRRHLQAHEWVLPFGPCFYETSEETPRSEFERRFGQDNVQSLSAEGRQKRWTRFKNAVSGLFRQYTDSRDTRRREERTIRVQPEPEDGDDGIYAERVRIPNLHPDRAAFYSFPLGKRPVN